MISRISGTAADEVVTCEECGAIMVRTPEVGPVRVVVEADGGSRGNPGPAGYGAVVFAESGEVLAERAEGIGVATNNVAEYRGLIAGLAAARVELGADRGRGPDGLEAGRRADVRPLADQARGAEAAGARRRARWRRRSSG